MASASSGGDDFRVRKTVSSLTWIANRSNKRSAGQSAGTVPHEPNHIPKALGSSGVSGRDPTQAFSKDLLPTGWIAAPEFMHFDSNIHSQPLPWQVANGPCVGTVTRSRGCLANADSRLPGEPGHEVRNDPAGVRSSLESIFAARAVRIANGSGESPFAIRV